MKIIILLGVSIIVTVLGIYFVNPPVKEPVPMASHTPQAETIKTEPVLILPQNKPTAKKSVTQGVNNNVLERLPVEQQEEIKRLSGRYHKNVKPIEVKPGVFVMPANKNVRSVSVAVKNEDGTVSVHEF